MDILAKFGIDPSVMLAQAVNFFALLGILTWLVYRPLLNVLEARKNRIVQADKNATEIEKKLKKVADDVSAELAKAQTEAAEIIANTKKMAKNLEAEMVAEAKIKVTKVVEEGRAILAQDREAARAELQAEVAKIVLLATEKLLGRELQTKDHAAIVGETLKLFSKQK